MENQSHKTDNSCCSKIAPIIAPLIAPIIEIVMKFSLSRNRRNIRFTDRKDEKIETTTHQ